MGVGAESPSLGHELVLVHAQQGKDRVGRWDAKPGLLDESLCEYQSMAGPRSITNMGFALLATVLVAAACGGDGDGSSSATSSASGDGATSVPAITSEEVCALLSDAEMESLVGEPLPAEPIGPDSPNIGCSWNLGSVLVQVSVGQTTPVTAPGQECTPVDGLGSTAIECAGSVQFITNGTRVRISTDGFPLSVGAGAPDILAVARALEPKIAARG